MSKYSTYYISHIITKSKIQFNIYVIIYIYIHTIYTYHIYMNYVKNAINKMYTLLLLLFDEDVYFF